ncbi:LPS-assembly protein LptD [Microvirga sp. STS02]|uniref:putative LPS assembly protein LptD n=1 Tax=Hymenobacter negativus TaxID=2795026 RepID=UPI0018DE28B5|nr:MULTISPECIES: putative LPS assembly protein LptD [Bacteria]MBH8568724.1 LPS-assembly protein LptD [Hymenobacter negativus]MBR7208458.1 LPS-assembly protein LptD [Microvirga sp. STS02]
MPVWFGLRSEADFRPAPRRRTGFLWAYPALSGLLFLLLTGLPGTAWGQTGTPAQPKPKTAHKAKVQARKARVKAILAAPTSQGDTTTVDRPKAIPAAKPGQRAGSAPTPPVRNISVDPRDPVGPPPPGVRNTGQARIPGASRKPVPDTLARPSGLNSPSDTSRLVNGVRRTSDSLKVAARPKGQIETTINYKAQDSIQFDVTQKVAKLYNKSSVTYGETDLKAYLITINYGTNTMQADGRLDSLKHKLEGRPVLKDKGGLYTAGSIAYNFKSKKAKVTEAVTTQGEGYVSAATIKRMPNGDINGLLGRYTTCNLEHPHFYIQAKKMKVIPGEKVVTGPFNLVIGDIPTPLGFLFGFFPTPNKSRGSGVLIPTFGQAADRGYYLTNGGYYFAPNDYIGIRLTGDIYAGNAQTWGGFGATADFSYLKRYTYQGNFNFRFSNRPLNPILATDALTTTPVYIKPPSSNSFWVTWNHTPVPKPGGGRFTASVNAGTSSFNKVNSLDARRYLSTQFSSSIGYSKQIRNSPWNYDIKVSQSQGTDGKMTFVLPDISVGLARQYPYQWFGIQPGAGGKLGASTYEQFTFSYNLTARNELSNVLPARSLSNGLPLLGGTSTETNIPISFANIGRLLANSRNGIQHQFGIGLGSYSLGPHLKLSPSVSYSEVWFTQKLNYSYSPVAQAVRIDTTHGFNRVYGYSAALSLNTTFYGTIVRKGTHKIQAIRHKATPSLNYAYAPPLDKNTDVYPLGANVLNGYTNQFGQTLYANNPTDAAFLNSYAFNNYSNFLYSVPGGARQSQISFSLQNSVEMKVRDSKDTTGLNPFKKVSLIDGLDFNIGYNFAALPGVQKLTPLNVIFRTQVAKKLSLNSGASFEAYQRDSQGRPINKFLFEADPRKLLRLASATFQTNYTFNPASGKKKSAVPRAVAPANNPSLGAVGPNYYADYVDFDIPWELNLSYSAGYTTNAVPLTSEYLRKNQRPPLLALNTIRADGSIKLTENLRFTTGFGYDFTSQAVTFPTVSFFRDLHCWQINGTWIPFGQLKGYNFTIAAKSSLLQDLKLNRNRYAQYQ